MQSPSWPFKPWGQSYEPVAHEEVEGKVNEAQSTGPTGTRTRPRPAIAIALGILLLAVAFVTWTSGFFGPLISPTADSKPSNTTEAAPAASSSCRQRQEWRTLHPSSRQAYISAVLCLLDQPSALLPRSNRTAYSDFPWIHSRVGYFTHHSAPFLPWHRYFLHIYETTLRDKCGYTGSLVYWDWTLDSDALEKSPVFDAASGFGGDGEVGGEISIGRSGRCVVDGPFSGIVAEYYDVNYHPHCLSRSFRDTDGNLGHMDGDEISSSSIEEVLSTDSYEEFVTLIESRVHDAIPFGIGGNFETFTAPYDPLFFLHHTQLDRLWWLWQQRDIDKRLSAYGGHRERHSMELASPDDEIKMQGFAPSISVSEVMDVKGDLLCYTY